MAKPKISEQDLVRRLVPCLQDWGWEVYQEVEGPGGRADIVAVQGPIQWAIEAKLSFGLPVIEQAHNWRVHCHYSSVAVPSTAGCGSFPMDICRTYGIGLLKVQMWDNEGVALESIKPKLNRRPLLLKLHEEQKTYCEAGGNRGGYFTPFKRTCRNLVAMVQSQPGIEFKALIKAIDQHYRSLSTARSCLFKMIQGGIIPEVKLQDVAGRLLVFPADHPGAQPEPKANYYLGGIEC